jgi:lysozyme family protein
MADFNTTVQKTLVHEGGYVNNSHDAGGETYKGISRVHHPEWAGWAIIDDYKHGPNFPRILETDARLQQLVVKVYVDGYWKNLYSQIDSQPLAEKLFDMGVLLGVGTAVKMLQISMTHEIGLVSDGVFGENTLAAINQSQDALLPGYRATLIQHCINIVNVRPENGVFVNGWIARINS